uniref:DED domain-containing protein n=1 Tax=Branchiostoma floridae TaxID=7739 RepID=C3ZXH3_BRAFL|eukprot:XP_002586741.1 hypothetical protein BRAFLDRAFT_105739 [Branchiostoma floridae]
MAETSRYDLFLEISQNLNKTECSDLRTYVGSKRLLPARDLQDMDPQQIFVKLEHKGKLKTGDLSLLVDLMTKINRDDFANEAKQIAAQEEKALKLQNKSDSTDEELPDSPAKRSTPPRRSPKGRGGGVVAGKRTGVSSKRRATGSSSKPVVLMINDEYGTRKGGISTIHRGMAFLLASKGAKVYSTVLEATQEDRKDAEDDGVELILPEVEDDDTAPNLKWLSRQHRTYYPNLPTEVDFILGHVNITSRAAKKIKEERLPEAKLVQVTHVIPEDVGHYKSDARVLTIGDESDNILEDLKHADVIFSVGPLLYDYYKSQTRQLKPHFEYLPEPSDIFSRAEMTYVDTETKVVLSIGRVKGVERLKGYDLAARSMGMVIDYLPHTKWRGRGVTAEDFPESKAIIQGNMEKGKFNFTPLKYGTQEDLSKDMQQAHVVLMPSRAEPFGLVGLEAIAAGVPVLVSHKSGLAWFLRSQDPEFDRLIVEIEDDDEEASKTLSKRIIKILKGGNREFQAARSLKEKLMASRYWEASHRQFLEAFGL